jgi:dTDP-3-amino-3,4,6-trideoxy-alpha-D-glucose transaminase
MAVHLHGIPCGVHELRAECTRLGIDLLEDAAQAHGAACNGIPCGAYGRAAAFSFYPGKNLGALSDGGGVACEDGELATRLRMWRNYGSREKYRHELPGWNSRLSDLDARFLSRRLARLEADNSRRRELAGLFRARIVANPALRLPDVPAGALPCWHIFPVLTPHRQALQEHLLREGIQTLVHYPLPVHRQPSLPDLHVASCPHAEDWCAQTLSLPLHPLLSEGDAGRILGSLDRFRP